MTELCLCNDSLDQFRAYLLAGGRSALTAKAYCSDLSTFLTLTSKETLAQADYEIAAMEYLNSRRGEAARSTIRRLTSFKAFARWAWKCEVLSEYKSPEPAEPEPHPLPGGMADIRAMLAVCEKPDHIALVGLQGFFALRVSEARGVWPDHFDLHEMQLHVRGKGSKDRHIDYSESTFAALAVPVTRAIADGTGLCRLSDPGARLAIKRIASEAGIAKDVSSHDLRATCLTELYDRTRDIELVRRFAGHASVKQTQVYIGSRREALRAAVEFAA